MPKVGSGRYGPVPRLHGCEHGQRLFDAGAVPDDLGRILEGLGDPQMGARLGDIGREPGAIGGVGRPDAEGIVIGAPGDDGIAGGLRPLARQPAALASA